MKIVKGKIGMLWPDGYAKAFFPPEGKYLYFYPIQNRES